MKPALLVVDVQNDFLNRPGLVPARALLIERLARLAGGARSLGVPVLHVHTRTDRDGINRMAHLKRQDAWICVEGAPGAESPPEVGPLAGEAVFTKSVFDAFSDSALSAHLAGLGVDTLIIAGLYMHACVRETALAAYENGFRVLVAGDAVSTYDPLHGEITRRYLAGRGMAFLSTEELIRRMGGALPRPAVRAEGAWIDGRWRPAEGGMQWGRRNPSRWDESLGEVGEASDALIESAVVGAARNQPAWAALGAEGRAAHLRLFAQALENRQAALTQAMITEIGKPLRDAEAEVARAVELIHGAIELFGTPRPWPIHGKNVCSRRAPVGVVAAVTPFNHPVSIAVGKLAPALALGNAVVWKPSLAATMTTRLVVEALAEAEVPQGLVAVVFGDGRTAQRLAGQPEVTAVTVTASIAAGRQMAMLCGDALKPLQAELGGNNAVVVMGEVDIARVAREIALSAFSFAGQRCTAGRRILVERSSYARLVDALAAATEALPVGEPVEDSTVVGPLVSKEQQEAVARAVAGARRAGARVVCGGEVPKEFTHGCWYAPTIVTDAAPASALFREELFGPVAVVHPVTDIEEALELVNAVDHGLVATLYSGDEAVQRRFIAEVRAGVVKLNCPPAGVHADAPFGGWKASGLGPPEHGVWDEEFYTRAQALYGFAPVPEEAQDLVGQTRSLPG